LVRDKIGHKYGYVNPSPRSSLAGETPTLFYNQDKDCKTGSPSYFLPSLYSPISNEDDSGFESLATVTSDSSSNSSRIPLPSSPPSKSPDMFRQQVFPPSTELQLQQLQPKFVLPERKQFQPERKPFHLSQVQMHRRQMDN